MSTPGRAVGSLQRVGFGLDITQHTNPGILVIITIEQSFDGGSNWELLGGMRCPGGTLRDGPQGLNTTSGFELSFPIKGIRTLRANIQISGGSLTTSGTLWWI